MERYKTVIVKVGLSALAAYLMLRVENGTDHVFYLIQGLIFGQIRDVAGDQMVMAQEHSMPGCQPTIADMSLRVSIHFTEQMATIAKSSLGVCQFTVLSVTERPYLVDLYNWQTASQLSASKGI